MIIRDPHAHASDVGKLSRELKLALDEQLRNTISRRDAFKVFEDIVSRYVSNIDSTVFHLFAERWLYKVQYMYLVETSAKPALIRMCPFGEGAILDFAGGGEWI